MYADADFAGCPRTLRSTSGVQIQVEGPNTRFPLLARSIRQQAFAYSTPDAELAAINIDFRAMLAPALDMWETLLACSVVCFVHADNSACISVIIYSGKNPTVMYLNRTQGIDIQMLHEFVGWDNPDCPCALVKTVSDDMVADIHINGFPDADSWVHAHTLANVFYFAKCNKLHVGDFAKQSAILKSNTLLRPEHAHDLNGYLLQSDAQAEKVASLLLPLPLARMSVLLPL